MSNVPFFSDYKLHMFKHMHFSGSSSVKTAASLPIQNCNNSPERVYTVNDKKCQILQTTGRARRNAKSRKKLTGILHKAIKAGYTYLCTSQ